MTTQVRSLKNWIICAGFGLFAQAAASQVTIAFQGGEPGDAWGYTSTLASTTAISEAQLTPNKVTGTTSIVVGGNTGGGSCFAGGSGNGPAVARTFTFNATDISQSNDYTRTLVFNWGNRYPVCNGTGWDAGEDLVFTAYHDGVAQPSVTLATGSGNAPFSILTNQYTWSIPPCVNSFYFVVSVTTNRADELLFLDNVRLTTPFMNATTAQPSPISGTVLVCAGGTGTYSVAGVAGTTYTWSGLPPGAQFTSPNGNSSIDVDWGTAAAGTYTLSVTPSNACGAVGPAQTVTITIEGTPVPLTISGPTSFCPGETIVLSSNYTTGNVWSTSETTQDITVFIAGTYTVTVQTACSTLTASQTISEIPGDPATITAGGPTTFCQGGSVTLTSGSPTGNTWSTGETTPSITVSTAGTYTLTLAGGCGSATASETITVNTPPTATIAANGSTALCPSQTVVLMAFGGDTYLWSNGATTQAITVSAPGTYSVTATNDCGSDVSAPISVTALPAPTAQINGSTSFCAGDSVLLTATGGTSYVWSTGETGSTIFASVAGNYTVTSTNSCGSVTSAPFTVTRLAPPTAQINGNTSFCAGDSVLLTATGGTSYVWSTGETGNTIHATTGGSYTVTSTNSCGSTTSAPFTVTQLPLPVPQIAGNASFCAGSAVTLTASGGTSYVWSTGETTPAITVAAAGSYTVAATNSCGTVLSVPFTVTQTALPSAQIAGPAALCPGETIVLTASGGTAYQWSTGTTTAAISVSAAGTYTVTAINACGSDAASTTITQNTVQASFTANPVSGNAPLPVDFTNTSPADATVFQWTFGDGQTSSLSDPSHMFTEAGTYTVTLTVQTAGGCTDSESLEITVLAEPSSLLIPNVFTPNGDGDNDLFIVGAVRIETFRLQLFNRWGNQLKEITDWKDGWDGLVNGDPASAGTYFYKLEATGTDNKQYNESGFFNLVR